MHSDLREKISSAATAVEIALSVIILLACIIAGGGMLFTTNFSALFADPDYLQTRLSDACFILIGIELIKMIASYTIDSVVDVMLLAVARQMIVEHTAPLENMLAVLAVGTLFVIRKYLYVSQIDKRKPQSKKELEELLRAQMCEDKRANTPDEREYPLRGAAVSQHK